jgi:hypothetical protein
LENCCKLHSFAVLNNIIVYNGDLLLILLEAVVCVSLFQIHNELETTEQHTAPAAIAAPSSPNRPTVFYLTLHLRTVNKTAMAEKAAARRSRFWHQM